MAISGLRRASWYDPTTGDVWEADAIGEDGEFYSQELETQDTLPTGEQPYASDESHCEVIVYDRAVVHELEAMQRANQRVCMVAAGVQENIQWYERSLVKVQKRFGFQAGGRNGALVTMHRKGHGQHDIHSAVNLLAPWGWADEDGNGLVDDWKQTANSFNDLSDLTFASGEQQFSSDLNNQGIEGPIGRIVFPVTVDVRMGFDVVSSAGDVEVQFEKSNFADTLRSASVAVLSSGDSPIRVDETLSMTRYGLRIGVIAKALGEMVTVANPSIRVDDSKTYVTY